MPKVVITPKAFSALDEIKSHISQDSEEAARKYVDKVLKKIEGLSKHAHLGISLERKWGIPTKYQFIVCHSHLAFYKIEGNYVKIYRVLHKKRDYLSILDLREEENVEIEDG